MDTRPSNDEIIRCLPTTSTTLPITRPQSDGLATVTVIECLGDLATTKDHWHARNSGFLREFIHPGDKGIHCE